MEMTEERALSGRLLRYAVALTLHQAQRTMTLEELATAMRSDQLAVRGDMRKAISDALRWELHKGRAVRMSRGRYRSRGLARSTVAWMRAQVQAPASASAPVFCETASERSA